MVTTMDTVVHIPPQDQDEPPPSRSGWITLSLSFVAIAVAVVLVSQTRPLPPAYEWSRLDGPPGPVNLDSVVALDDGFAVLSGITREGVNIWWTGGDGRWQSQLLDGAPTQLSSGDGRLAAYRVRTGTVLALEGDRWVRQFDVEFPDEARSRQASGRASVLVTTQGLLEMSLFGDVWQSGNGDEFSLVIEDPRWGQGVEQPFSSECRPPSRSSPDVPPFVVTDSQHVALVSANSKEPFGIWPVCEPILWTSPDGLDWSFGTTSLTRDGAYVYDLAWRDGMMVAVGGYGIDKSAVWASPDGVDWEEITPRIDRAVDLYRVEAGAAGWVILGRESFSSEPVGWTSTDGSCWEPLPSPVGGSEAVVSEDGVLVIDRTRFPQAWLGTPSGSPGACR